MSIPWNKVTWYSKLGAVLVVIIAVALGFYFWNEYQKVQVLENSIPAIESSRNSQKDRSVELTSEVLERDNVNTALQSFAKQETYLELEGLGENEILLDAVSFNHKNLDDRIAESQRVFDEQFHEGAGDSIDARAILYAYTKLCLADSIVNNDLKNTLDRCEIDDIYPTDTEWYDYKANDLTASAQVVPYFLVGVAYYEENDIERARYYFDQILQHEKAMTDQYGVEALQIAGLAHEQILDAVNGFLVQDVSDWQTYRNEEFGYEVQYPENLQVSMGSAEGKRFIAKGDVNVALPESYLVVIDYEKSNIDSNQDGLSFEQWMNKTFIGRSAPRGSGQRAILAGREAYRTEGQSGESSFIDVYVMNDNLKIFSLSANAETKDELEIFDQILSTFRFVDLFETGEELSKIIDAFVEKESGEVLYLAEQIPESKYFPGKLVRIFTDFNSDGHQDIALSLSATWGNAGGGWDIYLNNDDNTYTFFENFFFSPSAISIEREAVGISRIFTYHHISVNEGSLSEFFLSRDNGIQGISGKVLFGDLQKDVDEYDSIFRGLGEYPTEEYCDLLEYIGSDGNCTWSEDYY
jgi:hypothetical protein